MHLLLVGGHLTPAIGFIQAAIRHEHRCTLVGRPTLGARGLPSPEPAAVTQLGQTFIPFSSPKLDSYQPLSSFIRSPLLIKSYFQALSLLKSAKPEAMVTFGGYLSVPLGMAAVTRGVPLIIHEQTAVAGLANEWLGRFAQQIALSYPQSRRFFPRKKCHLVGNILRSEILTRQTKPPSWFDPLRSKPLLYATGGSQGSRFLNHLIAQTYPELGARYTLVHQTGYDPESLVIIGVALDRLTSTLRSGLITRPQLSAQEAAWCLQNAHFVISRAGANTVSELLACSTPSILIPLCQTHHHEQAFHAHLIASGGGGLHLPQDQATNHSLAKAISRLTTNYPRFKVGMKNLRYLVYPRAAQTLVELVETTVK